MKMIKNPICSTWDRQQGRRPLSLGRINYPLYVHHFVHLDNRFFWPFSFLYSTLLLIYRTEIKFTKRFQVNHP